MAVATAAITATRHRRKTDCATMAAVAAAHMVMLAEPLEQVVQA